MQVGEERMEGVVRKEDKFVDQNGLLALIRLSLD